MDAPSNATEGDVRSGAFPVFRTQENAILAGWHEWETNWVARVTRGEDWRATGLSCETTVLSGLLPLGT